MITRRDFGLGSLGLAAGAILGRETGAAAESALVDSHTHTFVPGLPRAPNARYSPDYDASYDRLLAMAESNGIARVVIAQPEFSLARVLRSCQDAAQVGDILIPFEPIVLPPRDRPRPFSPTMTVTGGIKASIVTTLSVLLNTGSSMGGAGQIPGVRGGRLGSLERGIAGEGSILYIDAGQTQGVKPGDIFIAFRDIDMDSRLYRLPPESKKLRGVRTAIGEIIVLKVGERASTALVTYATDGLSLGDVVERR